MAVDLGTVPLLGGCGDSARTWLYSKQRASGRVFGFARCWLKIRGWSRAENSSAIQEDSC